MNSWEDFYRKGKKLGIPQINKLDILHDKYGGFKNVPNEELKDILLEIDDTDYDTYQFLEEMLDYFGWYDIINESSQLEIESRLTESINSKIESQLAESFEKAIKNLQKEGLLKEAKSFDLSFNGKSINIKLN